MTGRTLSLRLFALVFGLACAIFAITALYRGLLAYTDPMAAPIVMAVLSAVVAIIFVLMAQIRASRRRKKMKAVMSSLIDHQPLAGLAAAVVAGAAARFGIEPEDLFPIFESFTKSPNHQDTHANSKSNSNSTNSDMAPASKTSTQSTNQPVN